MTFCLFPAHCTLSEKDSSLKGKGYKYYPLKLLFQREANLVMTEIASFESVAVDALSTWSTFLLPLQNGIYIKGNGLLLKGGYKKEGQPRKVFFVLLVKFGFQKGLHVVCRK